MPHDPTALPEDLVAPVDDGAADHLPGQAVPPERLTATDGSAVSLAERCRGRRVVVFAYPRTGQPGVEPLVHDWDSIPGARGCTPQACGFRDLAAEFESKGVEVFGLSTQSTPPSRSARRRRDDPAATLHPVAGPGPGEASAIPGVPSGSRGSRGTKTSRDGRRARAKPR